MTSDSKSVQLPVLDVSAGGTNIRVDVGELLFPTAAFLFCVAYFLETRGLPDQSLQYADPLLYATALLAVLTGLGHALSITRPSASHEAGSPDDRDAMMSSDAGGAAGAPAEQEPSLKDGSKKPEDYREIPQTEESQREHFTVAAASGLVVLTGAYFASLYLVPFVAATPVFLAATVVLFGERRPLNVLVYSGGFTLLLWLTFISWLRVPLP